MNKIIILSFVLFNLSFYVKNTFANPLENKEDTLISYEELCSYDEKCRLLVGSNGQLKVPHRLLILLLMGFKDQLIELGQEYNIPAALPAAVIITEHSLNVGIEEKLQDALANTVYTRESSFLGLKSMSLGFGQINPDVAWLAEQEVAQREHRAPNKKYMHEQIHSIKGSLQYAAALLHIYAQKYKDQGFEIGSDVGVLGTLYNIGKVEQRIERTKGLRRKPGVNYFGWFVQKNWATYENILREETVINDVSLQNQNSLQANNQDYVGVEGAIRWALNSMYSTPVLARLKTKKNLRLFYSPVRCSNSERDNFVFSENDPSQRVTDGLRLAFKTNAVGFFQLMAVSFDCNGEPWAMLDFDEGASGWINFKDLVDNLNFNYTKVQCNDDVVKLCMNEIKNFVKSNDKFKNFIGKNVILDENVELGQIDLQVAPAFNKNFAKVNSKFKDFCAKEIKQLESNKNKKISNNFLKNIDPAFAFKLRYRVSPSKTNEYLKSIENFDSYLKAENSPYKDAILLNSNIKDELELLKTKILKDKIFESINIHNSVELKNFINKLKGTSLFSWISWIPYHLEHCSQNEACYLVFGKKAISDLTFALNTDSIWNLYSKNFMTGQIVLTTKKTLYEKWQKDHANIFNANSIEEDIKFIHNYCSETFSLDPQIKKDFENILNETIFSQNTSVLYPAFKLNKNSLFKFVNSCLAFTYLFKAKSDPKTSHKLQAPLTDTELHIKDESQNNDFQNPVSQISILLSESDQTTKLSYESLPFLPMNEAQIKSIMTIALESLKTNFNYELKSGQEFLEKHYPNLVDSLNINSSKHSFNGTLIRECTYNPSETFLRIEALSKLDCVQNILIPEENYMLAPSIQENFPVTIFPFEIKDRFVVQVKKSCVTNED